MSFGKPSNPEEEYFAREEQEKVRRLREQLDKKRSSERAKHAQALHWMKCPKCGNDLEEKLFRDVKADICSVCSGMWLDAGELQMLLKSSSDVIGNIVHSIDESFRRDNDES